MIIPDNIWVDHLRTPCAALTDLLTEENVLMHPFVVGEIALGSLHDRARIPEKLLSLLPAPVAPNIEVLAFIEGENLYGTGIGYVDCHLLASARMVQDGKLWTRDKRLKMQAERLQIAYVA